MRLFVAVESKCQKAVAHLTQVVTDYTDCVSQHALNASVCQRCIEQYLNAAADVANNFSVNTVLKFGTSK